MNKSFIFTNTINLQLILLLISCSDRNKDKVSILNFEYISEYKSALDSISKLNDSIILSNLESTSLKADDKAYLVLKHTDNLLKNKRPNDLLSLYGFFPPIITECNIDLKNSILINTAIAKGVLGEYLVSDTLFNIILVNLSGKPRLNDIYLKCLEKRAEMWRYDANNPQKAMDILLVQDSILNQIPTFTKFHRTQLYTLATTYRILGKLDEALTTATELRIKLQEQPQFDTAFYYSVSKVIANIYTDMEDRPEANKYFEEHLKYQESKNKVTAHDYLNFAIQLSSDFQYEKANEYLEKGRLLLKSNSDSFYYNRSMGFHLVHFEKNKESLPFLLAACKYCLKKPDQFSCPYNIQWLGEEYELMKNPDSALYYYNTAVNMLTGKSFDNLKFSEFNKHENIEFYFLAFQRANLEKYRHGKKTSDLLKVLEYAGTMEKYFNDISYFSTGIQKLIDFQIFHELFGYGAYASFKLWEQKKDSSYLYRTFTLLEKCKSSDWDKKQLVNEAGFNVNEMRALHKFDSLKRNIVENEVTFNKYPTSINSNKLRNTILEKEIYYKYILDSFPLIKNYIDSNSVYVPEFNKIKTRSDTSILVYFHTNRLHTYQYFIKNNQIECLELINKVSFLDTINSYLAFNKKLNIKANEQSLKSKYSNTIYSNYNLAKISNYNLIHIIPDGPLHSLSIEELIKENNFANKISQQYYSFSLEEALRIKTTDTPKVLLAMAYGKSNDNDVFASLPGSIKEVDEVAKKFNGNKIIFKNNEVTKENFIKYAPQADYIYLATHSQSNNYSRFKNRLVFHGRYGNEYLNSDEALINLFNSKIVNLSACESNLGVYFKGSGNFSLARSLKNNKNFVLCNINKIKDVTNHSINIVIY